MGLLERRRAWSSGAAGAQESLELPEKVMVNPLIRA